MRVVVVEDEGIAAGRLMRLVSAILGNDLRSIALATSFVEARERLERDGGRGVDLLLLDLNLHGDDGFRLLAESTAGPFQTIVVSAQHDQALRAYELGVIDFVAKPYDEQRLRQAIGRMRRREDTLRNRLRFLAVKRGAEILPVPVDSILFVKGADDYSELHCNDGSTHLHGKTLSGLMRLLPESFARVHRSYIVNSSAVAGYRSEPGSRYYARLASGAEIPVSRSRYKEIMKRLG